MSKLFLEAARKDKRTLLAIDAVLFERARDIWNELGRHKLQYSPSAEKRHTYDLPPVPLLRARSNGLVSSAHGAMSFAKGKRHLP